MESTDCNVNSNGDCFWNDATKTCGKLDCPSLATRDVATNQIACNQNNYCEWVNSNCQKAELTNDCKIDLGRYCSNEIAKGGEICHECIRNLQMSQKLSHSKCMRLLKDGGLQKIHLICKHQY